MSSSSTRIQGVDAFFARHGVSGASARASCRSFIRARFPGASGADIRESPGQGYCSYTVCVGAELIVQFRPAAHGLDVELAALARDVYGELAPRTELLGTLAVDRDDAETRRAAPRLLVYAMTRIPGVSLAQFDARRPRAQRRHLVVRDFAQFIARAWQAVVPASSALPRARGLVGRTLRWRVEKMALELPARFRPAVAGVLAALPDIEALPWALTHGDVVPSNIMVVGGDGGDGGDDGPRLAGMLDWAEAEFLPLGIGLHGAEELFGRTEPAWDGTGPYPPRGSCFAYYADEPELRRAFWAELEAAAAAVAGGVSLRPGSELRATVELARVLGILLWHGIAFDDGRLDRVVQEGRDDEEIQRLDLFLLGVGRRGDPSSFPPVSASASASEHGSISPPQKECSPTTTTQPTIEDRSDSEPDLAQRRVRRRLSLSDAVKAAWAYVRHLHLPGPVVGRA